MKTIIASFALLLCCTFAKAQLTNTKWTGTILADVPMPVTMEFKKDTLNVLNENGDVFEAMLYTAKDNVVTIKKIYGQSPCDEAEITTIKYAIKDDKLSWNVLTDACNVRLAAWDKQIFEKVKPKP